MNEPCCERPCDGRRGAAARRGGRIWSTLSLDAGLRDADRDLEALATRLTPQAHVHGITYLRPPIVSTYVVPLDRRQAAGTSWSHSSCLCCWRPSLPPSSAPLSRWKRCSAAAHASSAWYRIGVGIAGSFRLRSRGPCRRRGCDVESKVGAPLSPPVSLIRGSSRYARGSASCACSPSHWSCSRSLSTSSTVAARRVAPCLPPPSPSLARAASAAASAASWDRRAVPPRPRLGSTGTRSQRKRAMAARCGLEKATS